MKNHIQSIDFSRKKIENIGKDNEYSILVYNKHDRQETAQLLYEFYTVPCFNVLSNEYDVVIPALIALSLASSSSFL